MIPCPVALIYFDEETWGSKIYLFHFTVVLNCMLVYLPAFEFLWIAYNDTSRRNIMMERLSSSLELDFHKKCSISVRLPTINFLDPQTLHSWVEARKLTLSIGARFSIRMQIYISIYLLLTAFTIGFLFALGFGFIN